MSDTAASLQQLLDIMAALRDPASGCPWDLAQDFASIAPHTLEEVYEVIDAIEQGEPEQLKSELGDLLFQIVFYARLGEEQGRFSFGSIAEGISRKLLERHPNVFPAGTLGSAGSAPGIGAEQVAVTWEQIKQAEREQKQPGETSVLDDVPLALPAMLRAAKLQKRAAHVGFDWKDSGGVLEKVREELGELDQALRAGDASAVAEEFGDLLFSMVNLSRHLALNSETALRQANRKFERRFRAMEALARAEGNTLQSMDAAAQERLWQRAKAAED